LVPLDPAPDFQFALMKELLDAVCCEANGTNEQSLSDSEQGSAETMPADRIAARLFRAPSDDVRSLASSD
jgi:hypothetical protein